MMREIILFFMLSSCFLLAVSGSEEDDSKKTFVGYAELFNGKTLEGWESARNAGSGSYGDFGVDLDQHAIHVYPSAENGTKQATDVLYTEIDYSRYILKLEYKWGDNKFVPRVNRDRDSGVLFHISGDLNKVWPDCLEMQIGESLATKIDKGRYHTGDLYVLGIPTQAKVRMKEKFFAADEPLVTVSENEGYGSCWTMQGQERPHGEWNQMEIHVDGSRKATFFLNGVQTMQVEDMVMNRGGDLIPLGRGRIGLQAEWAEIFFRNIKIKPL